MRQGSRSHVMTLHRANETATGSATVDISTTRTRVAWRMRHKKVTAGLGPGELNEARDRLGIDFLRQMKQLIQRDDER